MKQASIQNKLIPVKCKYEHGYMIIGNNQQNNNIHIYAILCGIDKIMDAYFWVHQSVCLSCKHCKNK